MLHPVAVYLLNQVLEMVGVQIGNLIEYQAVKQEACFYSELLLEEEQKQPICKLLVLGKRKQIGEEVHYFNASYFPLELHEERLRFGRQSAHSLQTLDKDSQVALPFDGALILKSDDPLNDVGKDRRKEALKPFDVENEFDE